MSLKEIIKVADFYQIKYKFAGEERTALPSFNELLEEFGLNTYFIFKKDIPLFEKMEMLKPFNKYRFSSKLEHFDVKSRIKDWISSFKNNDVVSEAEKVYLLNKIDELQALPSEKLISLYDLET